MCVLFHFKHIIEHYLTMKYLYAMLIENSNSSYPRSYQSKIRVQDIEHVAKKRDKPRQASHFISSSTRLIDSIKHEHSCKGLYIFLLFH